MTPLMSSYRVEGVISGAIPLDQTYACDVEISNGVITRIAPEGSLSGEKIFSGSGSLMTGIIDVHNHPTAGGRIGTADSVSFFTAEEYLSAGVTHAVGCLGQEVWGGAAELLLLQTRALKNFGLNAHMYAGGISELAPSIGQSSAHDIALIEEVVGLKIATSHIQRSFTTSIRKIHDAAEIAAQYGSQLRLHIHVGSFTEDLAILPEFLEQVPENVPVMLTHCNWSKEHLIAVSQLVSGAIFLDLTACIDGEKYPGIPIKEAVNTLFDLGVAATTISVSSDGNGGKFEATDSYGKFVRDELSNLSWAWNEVFTEHGTNVAQQLFNRTPGAYLGLQPFEISVGAPSDLVIRDEFGEVQFALTKFGQKFVREQQ